MIKTQRPGMFTLSDSQPNMKGVAYLTDPANWKTYSDELVGALYAIGSPTIELFRASFNAARINHENMSGESAISPLTLDDCGYNVSDYRNWAIPEYFEAEWCNGIYRKGDSNSWWWLASPCYETHSAVWCIGEHERPFQLEPDTFRTPTRSAL